MGVLERTLVAMAIAGCAATAIASETSTYTYDARGRLIRVDNNGIGNNTVTNYVYDKADNRTNRNVTGAPK